MLDTTSGAGSVRNVTRVIMHIHKSINELQIRKYVVSSDRLSPDSLARLPHSIRCFAVGIPASIYPGDAPLRLAAYLTVIMFKSGLNVSRTPPLQLLLHLYSTRQIGRVVKLLRRWWSGDVIIAAVSLEGRECFSSLERHLTRICGARPQPQEGVTHACLSTLRRVYGIRVGVHGQDDVEKDILNAVAYSVIRMLRKSA